MASVDPASPRVWVLNLDAEHELEGGARYRPTRHLRALVERESARLFPELCAPGDLVLREAPHPGDRAPELELLRLPGDREGLVRLARDPSSATELRVDLDQARGLAGATWSPTPRALAALATVGACAPKAPSVDVLRTVNGRPFAATLREPFRDRSFAKAIPTTLDEALAAVARPAPLGWLVRRTFGAAGRGRRRVRAGRPAPAELSWIEASLRRGPLVVEPWVEVTAEFTLSGSVDGAGSVHVSQPCFQQTTAEGAWTATRRAGASEVDSEHDQVLGETFERVGRALAATGYFGPFGIDAYLHRVPGERREVLNPLSEINARYTMDWAVVQTVPGRNETVRPQDRR